MNCIFWEVTNPMLIYEWVWIYWGPWHIQPFRRFSLPEIISVVCLTGGHLVSRDHGDRDDWRRAPLLQWASPPGHAADPGQFTSKSEGPAQGEKQQPLLKFNIILRFFRLSVVLKTGISHPGVDPGLWAWTLEFELLAFRALLFLFTRLGKWVSHSISEAHL